MTQPERAKPVSTVQQQKPVSKELFMRSALVCSDILIDKLFTDKLFRMNTEVENVRRLKKSLYEGNYDQIEEEIDPHVVAGTLLHILKDMEMSLFYHIYEDILSTDITEDILYSKLCVVKHLNKLDVHHCELIRSIFILLFKISRQGGMDLNSAQLAQTLSPYLCRRMDSAFMSIRHLDDLRKIKPVILFMIDHFDDVGRDIVPAPALPPTQAICIGVTYKHPIPTVTVPTMTNKTMNFGISSESQLHSRMPPSISITVPSIHVPSGSCEQFPSKHPRNYEAESLHSNYRQHIELDMSTFSDDRQSSSYKSSLVHEWNILRALVGHKVECFIRGGSMTEVLSPDKDRIKKVIKPRVEQKYFNRSNDLTTNMDNDDDDDMLGINDAGESVSIFTNTDTHFSGDRHIETKRKLVEDDGSRTRSRSVSEFRRSPSLGLSERRLMVTECRSLRNQIQVFEDEWKKQYGSLPKGQDRGHMMVVYSRYKDMKKWIRDRAAVDIQKLIRRYLERSRFLKLIGTTKKHSRGNQHTSAIEPPVHGIPVELYARYRSLLGQKRELKRTLKKFDEDFFAKNSHAPRKADKEVMRPLYQNYHIVKGELDSIRHTIEASHGYLPDELRDDAVADSYDYQNPLSEGKRDRSGPCDAFPGGSDAAFFELAGSDTTSWSMANGWSSQEVTEQSNQRTRTELVADETLSEGFGIEAEVQTFESLQEEKKNLHAYLKAYERDFKRIHGRPVMKHEDIQPVVHEYERYKDVKALLRDVSKEQQAVHEIYKPR